MDALPFVSATVDLVVVNGSLHYSPDLERTLNEFGRVIKPAGAIVILDAPWYEKERDGERALRKSREALRRRHGLDEELARRSSFISRARFEAAVRTNRLTYKRMFVWPGVARTIEILKARFFERRIASFPLLVIRKGDAMNVVTPATPRVREAFDRHADEYDSLFSAHPMASDLRGRTWEVLDSLFSSGASVLDLGCGTGEDALHLAGHGVRVDAVDLSKKMIGRVLEKIHRDGVERLVRPRVEDYSKLGHEEPYDGIYSNFGALNCIEHLEWLGPFAARVLKPGGKIVLVLMGSFYPLEFTANLLKGRIQGAFRRCKQKGKATVAGVEFDVHYHRLKTVRRAMGPRFTLERTLALNLLLPVPGLEHLDQRFPWIFKALRPLDARLSRVKSMSTFGDHFLSVWCLDQ